MANVSRVIAGLLFVAASLLGVFAWMLAKRPEPRPAPVPALVSGSMFPVVIAVKPLVAGTPIELDALKVQRLPIDPAGSYNNPAQLVGRIPIVQIGARAPVLDAQLSSEFADRIESGERAVAVHVDESNAAGNRLRPGNFIDVFFTLKREGIYGGAKLEIPVTEARLLLSRVRVLAFGATDALNAGAAANVSARTAVLAVPVEDVDTLVLAEASGRLILALRNPRDTDVARPAGQAVSRDPPKMLVDFSRRNGSSRAAIGVTLAELSRGFVQPPVLPTSLSCGIGRESVCIDARARNSIQVIRGGRTETVNW